MMNFHSNSGWPKDGEKWFCLTLAMQQREEQDMILPGPDMIREARLDAALTQKQAARMVHSTESAWRSWEAQPNSDSYRQISGAHWELFIRKTDSLREKGSRFKLRKGI